MHNLVRRYAEENQERDDKCRQFVDLLAQNKAHGLGMDARKGLKGSLEAILLRVIATSKIVATTLSNSCQAVFRDGEFEP